MEQSSLATSQAVDKLLSVKYSLTSWGFPWDGTLSLSPRNRCPWGVPRGLSTMLCSRQGTGERRAIAQNRDTDRCFRKPFSCAAKCPLWGLEVTWSFPLSQCLGKQTAWSGLSATKTPPPPVSALPWVGTVMYSSRRLTYLKKGNGLCGFSRLIQSSLRDPNAKQQDDNLGWGGEGKQKWPMRESAQS